MAITWESLLCAPTTLARTHIAPMNEGGVHINRGYCDRISINYLLNSRQFLEHIQQRADWNACFRVPFHAVQRGCYARCGCCASWIYRKTVLCKVDETKQKNNWIFGFYLPGKCERGKIRKTNGWHLKSLRLVAIGADSENRTNAINSDSFTSINLNACVK